MFDRLWVCVTVSHQVEEIRDKFHGNTLQHSATHCNTLQHTFQKDESPRDESLNESAASLFACTRGFRRGAVDV